MRALISAILCFLLWVPALADEGIKPSDIRLELTLEDRGHPPHVGEMILLSIHGTFRIPVVRESLRQPSLDGLDWMQLGEDRWYKEREDGFEVLKFERRMALFPQRTGTITIDPFVHELEMLSRTGATIKLNHRSGRADITAAAQPESPSWWFPVRRIAINDTWSNQPEALPTGGAGLRIITLTIEGTAPQRIPPMPEMTGAGVYIFPHPPHKITALGPQGPVNHVFWRWTVRPEAGTAGYVNPVPLTYFDAETRAEKTITFAAQRIAYAGGPQTVQTPDQKDPKAEQNTDNPPNTDEPWGLVVPEWSVTMAWLVGLIGGLGAAVSNKKQRWRLPAWLRPDPDRTALKRALRQGKAEAVRHHAHRLVARLSLPSPDSLGALDRSLFGQGTGTPNRSDLDQAARAVLADHARHLHLAKNTHPDQRRRAISPR